MHRVDGELEYKKGKALEIIWSYPGRRAETESFTVQDRGGNLNLGSGILGLLDRPFNYLKLESARAWRIGTE